MRVKWKIFFALNFVLSLPALVLLILMIISFLNRRRFTGNDPVFLLFALTLLVITLNGFLNIYVLQRFFPDKLLPVSVKRLNILSLILNIPAAIIILIMCIYGASEEFGNDYEGKDPSGKTYLAIIFVLWLIQVVTLVMQGQLPGLISRNNREKMDSLIDSIGQ